MSKKIRTSFRKNRNAPPRISDWTEQYQEHGFAESDTDSDERIVGKGNQAKRLTVKGNLVENPDSTGFTVELEVDLSKCRFGRILSTHGLNSFVVDEQTGIIYRCQIRRLLKTLSTEQRNAVVAGDWVYFRPAPESDLNEGFIERIEPRRSVLCRTSRKRQHVLASNIDQVFIIGSASQPRIKPNLIDRIILTAEKMGIKPIVCINKIDLVQSDLPAGIDDINAGINPDSEANSNVDSNDSIGTADTAESDVLPGNRGIPIQFMPLAGVYAAMGLDVLFLSAKTGLGIDRFKQLLAGKASVVTGQSGVGKSSLLNAVDPTLELRTSNVSQENDKGKHTTTAAKLYQLRWEENDSKNSDNAETPHRVSGTYVLDTPGIRSFALWDVIPEEVAGFYRDIRPFVSQCQFDDCTHTHEIGCAVKHAVADGLIDTRRYESYCQIYSGELEET